ncbi:hypothetical protein H072_11039 [Dactylellina haptotyla CBS 200.50]|uniref:Uncharacterized protein n=1 Tax=Dactylellina haptotyla (strain CBS 200.50) TaxID=1284197 RepID=S7ZYI9_DACHA|nr:hypothetical protein H072_11039 [Dactylellina haptotyla CBS 200.50]
MLADDADLAIERVCRDRDGTQPFERCTHRDVGKKTHPDLLPRSEARFFVHDKSAGKIGGVYEQWIGSADMCRMRKSPLVVADLPYHVHLGIHLNYGLADKGYAAERVKLDEQQDTPLGRFLLDYAHENSCHGVCYGDRSLTRYCSCRIVEGGLLVWMVDLDILAGACCGECDVDVLVVGMGVAADTVDRVRDELSGEVFNLNTATRRQNALAVLLWEGLVTGRPKGVCCARAGRVCRAIRNLFVWTLCNPVYYTYRSAKDSGLLEFVEAINEVLMTNVIESQAAASEEDGPAKVDDVVKRLVDTGLVDFLLYACA